ncbi:Protein 21.1 [Giardia lamblia P15]|uniref:Protein 21.1 n=1 Tax=Giardia intestinalis (strain P15) TaxID=658858 RepID=E1EYR3_GIAIA|nr:Protein 21.1 [Giardia lamblia P15]
MLLDTGTSYHTELMLAATEGQATEVDRVIDGESGTRDTTGMTTLMYAARNNQCIHSALLQKEAGLCDNNGFSALRHALLTGSDQSIIDLYKAEYHTLNWTPLMEAVVANDIFGVELHIKNYARCQDSYGVTGLMLAAGLNYCNLLALLIDTETGMKDHDGVTALMRASLLGHTQAVTLLAPHESSIVDSRGWSALAYAISKEHTDIVKILIPYEYRLINAPSPDLRLYANNSQNQLLKELVCGPGLQFLIVDSLPPDVVSNAEHCSICLDEMAIVRALPCAHRLLCISCASYFQTTSDQCPICRAKVASWEIDAPSASS